MKMSDSDRGRSSFNCPAGEGKSDKKQIKGRVKAVKRRSRKRPHARRQRAMQKKGTPRERRDKKVLYEDLKEDVRNWPDVVSWRAT